MLKINIETIKNNINLPSKIFPLIKLIILKIRNKNVIIEEIITFSLIFPFNFFFSIPLESFIPTIKHPNKKV